ncbi:uncharacterized protein LOC144422156 isoform X1 [Styela clava]
MTENTDWPLHFIQFCITSTDNEEKLDLFLSAAKMVQHPVGTIADEEFNQELCEKEEGYQTHEEMQNDKNSLIQNNEQATETSHDEKTPHVIDTADGEQEIDSMSDDDEDDDDSEVDVMEEHQMEMLFSNDQGVPVIPTAPSFEDVLNKSNSTNVDQQFNVEFRVIPTELPRLKFGGKMSIEIHGQFYPMKTHKHGYYSINVVTQNEDLGYVYCYTDKSNKYIYEKLPSSGKTKLRERSFTPGFNIVQDIACFSKTSWIVDTWKKKLSSKYPKLSSICRNCIATKNFI